MVTVTDAFLALQARTTTRILNKTQPRSISKDEEKSSIDEAAGIVAAIVEIIDTEPDYVAPPTPVAGLLHFINQGDATINYIANGDTEDTPLTNGSTYEYTYDTVDDIPVFDFNPNQFYAIYPDGIDTANLDWLTAADAQAMMNQFSLAFANDWVVNNGNGNVNILNKNLIVTAQDATIRGSISQLQIIDTDNANAVVYNGLSELGADIIDILSTLNLSHHFKILITSSNSNTQIAITAGNTSGTIYKTQNLVTGDTDNNFTAPIRLNIYPAS